ncbi:hypothetical protein PV327_000735 [Microctonus hyperodae]|uniref:Uncharacterized protein n=1 Tax=Microctonus hyperodae TaxID=165561 RepID=A0AA39G7R5_MICHY|nr:hypothetical protein PV327_000735 [Microctonus hyperodae]
MGLLLSILVGCVGVIELLACLKHVTDDIKISPAPCLSYHDSIIGNPSYHDSLCSISHSEEIRIPQSTRTKLENLHEYSLRMRSELRSRGYGDASTLSEFSSHDLFGMSRTDSRISLDFDFIVRDAETRWNGIVDTSVMDKEMRTIIIHVDQSQNELNDKLILKEIREPDSVPMTLETIENVECNTRSLTPIPLAMSQEFSGSNSSVDLITSFNNDSGNELPSRELFEHVPVIIRRYNGSSSTPRSSFEEVSQVKKCLKKKEFPKKIESTSLDELLDNFADPQMERCKFISGDNLFTESNENIKERGSSLSRRSIKKNSKTVGSSRGSSILRKPTRLKSKNAEVSKSAENLVGKKTTKRQRDSERRKSDISIQTTTSDSCRDEWTNTSPTDSERSSISYSRSSVSVQVQTNFDSDDDKFLFNVPLSESKRDVSNIRDSRKSFINKRFPKSRSLDDNYKILNDKRESSRIPYQNSEYERREASRNSTIDYSVASSNGLQSQTKQSAEEDSFDEEFLDAEDESSSRSGPIEYCIPNVESSKAFWVNLSIIYYTCIIYR